MDTERVKSTHGPLPPVGGVCTLTPYRKPPGHPRCLLRRKRERTGEKKIEREEQRGTDHRQREKWVDESSREEQTEKKTREKER